MSLLGGSWVVISVVTCPLIWVISIVTLLINVLITTHEPPSCIGQIKNRLRPSASYSLRNDISPLRVVYHSTRALLVSGFPVKEHRTPETNLQPRQILDTIPVKLYVIHLNAKSRSRKPPNTPRPSTPKLRLQLTSPETNNNERVSNPTPLSPKNTAPLSPSLKPNLRP